MKPAKYVKPWLVYIKIKTLNGEYGLHYKLKEGTVIKYRKFKTYLYEIQKRQYCDKNILAAIDEITSFLKKTKYNCFLHKIKPVKSPTPSYKWFSNEECKYYPCHLKLTKVNCLFCYCPLHDRECKGEYNIIVGSNGKEIKDCSACLIPHIADGWEYIVAELSK